MRYALRPMLASDIDAVIAGMTVTEERLLNINFSQTYTTAKQVILYIHQRQVKIFEHL